jgi:uncharacterized OsmC-like protein
VRRRDYNSAETTAAAILDYRAWRTDHLGVDVVDITRDPSGGTMSGERIREAMTRVTQFFRGNPDKGLVTDKAAVAKIERGLICRADGPNGAVLISDMPKSVGGDASAPTPGWFLRAALANCDATVIAMRAAQLGVELTHLQVTVESTSDDRGMFGIVSEVPPGPREVRVRVEIASESTAPAELQDIVRWAEEHSPVGDAIRRAISVTTEIETR